MSQITPSDRSRTVPDRLELLDRGTDQARFNRVVKKCPPPGPLISMQPAIFDPWAEFSVVF